MGSGSNYEQMTPDYQPQPAPVAVSSKRPNISTVLKQLDDEVMKLVELISQLQDKVGPITVKEPTPPDKTEAPRVDNGDSDIVSHINDIGQRLYNNNYRLAAITRSLQL
jgi:hypothetical protein